MVPTESAQRSVYVTSPVMALVVKLPDATFVNGNESEAPVTVQLVGVIFEMLKEPEVVRPFLTFSGSMVSAPAGVSRLPKH